MLASGFDCEAFFGAILPSMYTLFQVLTLENWSMAVARPVMTRPASQKGRRKKE